MELIIFIEKEAFRGQVACGTYKLDERSWSSEEVRHEHRARLRKAIRRLGSPLIVVSFPMVILGG